MKSHPPIATPSEPCTSLSLAAGDDGPQLRIGAFCKGVKVNGDGSHAPVGVFDSLQVHRSNKEAVRVSLDTFLMIACEPGKHVVGLAFRDPHGRLLPEMYQVHRTIGTTRTYFALQTEVAFHVGASGLYRMEVDLDLDVIGDVPIHLSLAPPPIVH